MNENKIRFPYLSLTVCLSIMTCILLSLYSTIHWFILPNAYQILMTIQPPKMDEGIKENSSKTLKEIVSAVEKIIESAHKAMKTASLYHITGLSGLFLSIIALIREKRILPLPFGIVSGILGIITM